MNGVPERVTESAAAPDPRAADEGALDRDLACARCRYNLRGLRADGRCPECGAEIADTLRGDWLRHADTMWLHHLLRVIAHQRIVAAVGGSLAFVVAIVPLSLGWRWVMIGVLGLCVYWGLLAIFAVRFLAAPAAAPEACRRNISRIVALVGLVIALIGAAVVPVILWQPDPRLAELAVGAQLLIGPLGLVGAVAYMACWRYVHVLRRRAAGEVPGDLGPYLGTACFVLLMGFALLAALWMSSLETVLCLLGVMSLALPIFAGMALLRPQTLAATLREELARRMGADA